MAITYDPMDSMLGGERPPMDAVIRPGPQMQPAPMPQMQMPQGQPPVQPAPQPVAYELPELDAPPPADALTLPDLEESPIEAQKEAYRAEGQIVPEGIQPGADKVGQPIIGFKQAKEQKNILDRAKAVATGIDRGVSHFTFKILDMIPINRWRAGVKAADAETQREFEKAKEDYPIAASAGELAGEVVATLPLAGPFGAVMKGASAVGKALPTGLKTVGKYGTAGVGGAGLLAAMESQRYNPDAPSQIADVDRAAGVLQDPLSYAIPMAGQKLQTWLGKSRDLQKARETIPEIFPRDILEKGPARTVSHTFFDTLPAITKVGKRIRQMEGIGEDVHNVIRGISGNLDAVYAKDLKQFAANKLQMGLKRLEDGQKELWNKPFLRQKVENTKEVKDLIIESMDMIDSVKAAVPLAGKTKAFLQKSLRKPELTVDDLKNVQSTLGKVMSSVGKSDTGGLGAEVAREISRLRGRFFEPIQKVLSGNDLKDFAAAKEYSSRLFQMYDEMPTVKKALTDEIAAKQVIKSMLSETEKFNKSKVMEIMSPRGQNAVKAARIAEALEKSDVNGKVNLNSFIKNTSEFTNAPELLGDSYKSVQGLNKYLSSINEAMSTGITSRLALAGGLGAGAVANPAVLVAYPAMVFAANHPVLKNILGAMTKNLPDSTYKHLVEAATKHLTRAGFLVSDDGVLEEKKGAK